MPPATTRPKTRTTRSCSTRRESTQDTPSALRAHSPTPPELLHGRSVVSTSSPHRPGHTGTARPQRLLTQNSELKPLGVWAWTLPAWAGRLQDGRRYNTCPSAGVCRFVCYARNGTYRFPTVRAKHETNLRFVLNDLAGWEAAMRRELSARRFTHRWIRIHDSGGFFSDDYTRAWLRVIRARPNTMFYAYTKEVDRFRRLVEPDPPVNFFWVYSYGGIQDAALDPATDRVADVFPDEDREHRRGRLVLPGSIRPAGRARAAARRNTGQPHSALPAAAQRSPVQRVASRTRRRTRRTPRPDPACPPARGRLHRAPRHAVAVLDATRRLKPCTCLGIASC